MRRRVSSGRGSSSRRLERPLTRDLHIPPPPDRLRSSACTEEALRTREVFVRAAAEVWLQAGQTATADPLTDAADALARRRA